MKRKAISHYEQRVKAIKTITRLMSFISDERTTTIDHLCYVSMAYILAEFAGVDEAADILQNEFVVANGKVTEYLATLKKHQRKRVKIEQPVLVAPSLPLVKIE